MELNDIWKIINQIDRFTTLCYKNEEGERQDPLELIRHYIEHLKEDLNYPDTLEILFPTMLLPSRVKEIEEEEC